MIRRFFGALAFALVATLAAPLYLAPAMAADASLTTSHKVPVVTDIQSQSGAQTAATGQIPTVQTASPVPQVIVQPAPVPVETFGWGDFVARLLETVRTGAVGFAVLILSRWVPAFLKPFLTDQLLGRGLDWGYGAVEGAVKGQTLTVPIANEVIREAAQYARDHGAPWLLKWIGDTIEPKLIARLSGQGALPAAASAATLLE